MTAAPTVDTDDPIGRRYGSRTVLRVISRWGSTGAPRLVWAICDCGRASEVRLRALEDGDQIRCVGCSRRPAADAKRATVAAKWQATIGQRFGSREVIAYEDVDDRCMHMLRVRCDCGDERVIRAVSVVRTVGCKRCASGRPATVERDAIRAERAQRYEALLAESARECPEVWRLECTCPAGVRCHRCTVQIEAVAELARLIDGATLEEVGALLGLSRERIRQVEGPALRRLDTPVTRELAADLPGREDDWTTRYADG